MKSCTDDCRKAHWLHPEKRGMRQGMLNANDTLRSISNPPHFQKFSLLHCYGRHVRLRQFASKHIWPAGHEDASVCDQHIRSECEPEAECVTAPRVQAFATRLYQIHRMASELAISLLAVTIYTRISALNALHIRFPTLLCGPSPLSLRVVNAPVSIWRNTEGRHLFHPA